MKKLSPLNHRLCLAAICILALSGFGFLYSVVVGDSHGLRAWLLPFGPWFCALVAYQVLRRNQNNENNPG
jgi:hypothetical protein